MKVAFASSPINNHAYKYVLFIIKMRGIQVYEILDRVMARRK